MAAKKMRALKLPAICYHEENRYYSASRLRVSGSRMFATGRGDTPNRRFTHSSGDQGSRPKAKTSHPRPKNGRRSRSNGADDGGRH
jgi:hypothetical protein